MLSRALLILNNKCVLKVFRKMETRSKQIMKGHLTF